MQYNRRLQLNPEQSSGLFNTYFTSFRLCEKMQQHVWELWLKAESVYGRFEAFVCLKHNNKAEKRFHPLHVLFKFGINEHFALWASLVFQIKLLKIYIYLVDTMKVKPVKLGHKEKYWKTLTKQHPAVLSYFAYFMWKH